MAAALKNFASLLRAVLDDENGGPLAIVLPFVVFLFFFAFQHQYGVLGYRPYQPSFFTAYGYRSLVAAMLFFGMLAGLFKGRWRARLWNGGTLIVLLALAVYFSAIVSARPALMQGSDRAEQISIAITEIFAGRFPYLSLTPLGNPFTALSGSFLLALPAQLAFGRPELMSSLYLAIALFALAAEWRRQRNPLPFSLIAFLLFLNPFIVLEMTWGGDLLWCGALTMMFVLAHAAGKPRLGALLFGLLLCTRFSFYLLLPLWALYLFRKDRHWFRHLAIAAAVVALLELPMFLWDPQTFLHFAPLGVSAGKFNMQAPSGDNLLSDLLNQILPGGASRTTICSAALLLLSAALGLIADSIAAVLIGIAAIWGAAFFLMGPYFDVDFLSWIAFPLLGAIANYSNSVPPAPQSRGENIQS